MSLEKVTMVDHDKVLDVRNVWKAYGSNEVLKGVSLSIARGEVVSIAGPSGSGKSTLLRCINALEEIDRGAVFVDGKLIGYEERGDTLVRLSERKLAQSRCHIGMLFQHFNLFPHMTALENVMEGPVQVLGHPVDGVRRDALEQLARVGLSRFGDNYPRQLSGGQQQRVAIARALAMRPSIMLFDEPTSALDPELVGEVLEVMKDVAATGMTMAIVTHEMHFARSVGSRLIFMDGGEVIEEGPSAQVLDSPKSARAREFFGSVGGL